VIACDVKPFQAEGIARVDFDTLLRESDVIDDGTIMDVATADGKDDEHLGELTFSNKGLKKIMKVAFPGPLP